MDERMNRQQVEQSVLPTSTLRSLPATPQTLSARMAALDVPGVSVAVIADGALAWAQGYGLRTAGGSDRVTEQTLFQAASISKPTTALAVMCLVQEGRLDLDADVQTYLRSWRLPDNGGWQPRVTLRQLLSHTAGVTVASFPGYRRDRPVPTLAEVLDGAGPANTDPIRVDTVPGAQFRYSGGGTSIVQQVLMEVTGQPFPDLMHDLVLAPLGMTHSTFAQPLPQRYWPMAASGHRIGGGPVAGDWHVYPEMAAAGLWTTPTDLALLALEVQAAYSGRPGTILTRASVETMLIAQADGPVGVGFWVAGTGQQRRFGHTGGNEGFRCELVAYAARGLGAVVMTNSDCGQQLYAELLGTIARTYGWPLDPGERVGSFAPPPVVLDDAPDPAVAGDYLLRPDCVLRVVPVAAGLALHLPGQPPLSLRPVSRSAFFVEALALDLRFVRDDGGAVTGLVLRQNGTDLLAPRQR